MRYFPASRGKETRETSVTHRCVARCKWRPRVCLVSGLATDRRIYADRARSRAQAVLPEALRFCVIIIIIHKEFPIKQSLVYKIVTMAGPKARLSAAEWRGGDPVPVGEVWHLPNA